MIEGAGWAMYPISGGKEVNIVAFIQDENEWKGERVAREVTREEMEAEFLHFDHRLRKLLDVSALTRRNARSLLRNCSMSNQQNGLYSAIRIHLHITKVEYVCWVILHMLRHHHRPQVQDKA